MKKLISLLILGAVPLLADSVMFATSDDIKAFDSLLSNQRGALIEGVRRNRRAPHKPSLNQNNSRKKNFQGAAMGFSPAKKKPANTKRAPAFDHKKKKRRKKRRKPSKK